MKGEKREREEFHYTRSPEGKRRVKVTCGELDLYVEDVSQAIVLRELFTANSKGYALNRIELGMAARGLIDNDPSTFSAQTRAFLTNNGNNLWDNLTTLLREAGYTPTILITGKEHDEGALYVEEFVPLEYRGKKEEQRISSPTEITAHSPHTTVYADDTVEHPSVEELNKPSQTKKKAGPLSPRRPRLHHSVRMTSRTKQDQAPHNSLELDYPKLTADTPDIHALENFDRTVRMVLSDYVRDTATIIQTHKESGASKHRLRFPFAEGWTLLFFKAAVEDNLFYVLPDNATPDEIKMHDVLTIATLRYYDHIQHLRSRVSKKTFKEIVPLIYYAARECLNVREEETSN